MLSHFSYVPLCMTQWTVACQTPMSMGFSKARILEWVAMPFSKGSSWPRYWTHGISWVTGKFFTAESESHSVMSNSSRSHRLYSPWNPLGQNTEIGSLSLLQGIFPTQGLNPGLPQCMQILYQLGLKGSCLNRWATRKAPDIQHTHTLII